ncbi:T9SS type A sorting domain-containing protein [candidate division KSB1 bacterium]|nr:T9SS type A sorting domain-containing protein [candidate division KSB1 bacterium]
MKNYKCLFIVSGICFAVLFSIGLITAGGFLNVRAIGVPNKWDDSAAIPFNPDLGMLGTLTNAAAVNLVAANFQLWGSSNIPTSNLTFTNAGALTIDVTSPADFAMFDGVSDGLSPIIFDADGFLLEELGIPPGVVGMAGGHIIIGADPFFIREAQVILNGNYIDGDTGDGFEITLEAFGAAVAHEFGHFLNLGHSQVNGHFFIGDTDDPGFVTHGAPPAASMSVMFPFVLNIPGEPTGPTTDDIRTISTLYPAGGFPNLFGKIEGHIFENDGISYFQGANIVARNQANPFFDASSWVSGSLTSTFVPSTFGGYELNGLTNGASYTVEVVNINPQFVAGSRVQPLDPPVVLPGPEEFWNGANESGDPAVDSPFDFNPVVASGTVSGVDIIMNDPGKLIRMDKFDSNTEFILSVQSLISRFNMPNGNDDYAAVRYPIPASVDTPFTVTMASFFNNDDQTVWPRVLLTAPNGSNQPDLDNPLGETADVAGPERGLINVSFDVTRTSFEDLFVVIQFPPGEAVSASGSGGGPAIGADAGSVGRGGFEFGYVPGNLFSSDGITFHETNTAPDVGSDTRSVDAANWEIILEIAGNNLGPDKLEPNNDMSSATAIAYGESKKASIDPGGELDYFEFNGSAGDTIQADITAQTCGSELDGFMTLVNSNGDTIAQSNDEFVGFGTDPKLQAILPEDGNYFLIMDSWDNAENNDPVGGPDLFYELSLNTFSPPFEPNDSPAQATPVQFNERLAAGLDLKGDIDFYTFDAQTGDFLAVQVFLAGVGLLDPQVLSSLSPVVTLFDVDGTTVLDTENSTILQTTLPSDGTYFLAIADLDSGGGADFFYALSIEVGLELPSPVSLTANDGFKDKVELSWEPPQVAENEPNNTSNQIQELEGPSPILVAGNAEVSDAGALSINFTDGSTDDIEDLYVIRTESPGLNINMTGTVSDLDLWLFDISVTVIIAGPTTEDRGAPTDETISLSALAPGSYVIGVAIFDPNSAGPLQSPYRLTVSGDIPGTGPALQSFNIYRSETSNAVSSGSVIANVGFETTSFTDQNLAANTFFYQVTTVYDLGESPPSNEISAVVTSIRDETVNLPTTFALEQNYPNPFNPSTIITYAIPISHNNQQVKLEIFNALGQKVRTLINEQLSANFHTIEWDGTNDLGRPVTSGLYLYRIEAGSFVQVRKMLFLK